MLSYLTASDIAASEKMDLEREDSEKTYLE